MKFEYFHSLYWLLRRYWVLPHLYQQQHEMYHHNVRRCDDRIVSISQPYVRPIVRGKQDKPVEFGAKLSASLTGEGLAHVDVLRWSAFNEGADLERQVEAYKARYGHYPEVVLGDPVYGTQANRRYLKAHGIRFAGKHSLSLTQRLFLSSAVSKGVSNPSRGSCFSLRYRIIGARFLLVRCRLSCTIIP